MKDFQQFDKGGIAKSYLTSLKHTISIKIIIMSLTEISLFFLYQTVGNLSLVQISPDSSNFFSDFTCISLFYFRIGLSLSSSPFCWIRWKTINKSIFPPAFTLHWRRYSYNAVLLQACEIWNSAHLNWRHPVCTSDSRTVENKIIRARKIILD